MAMQKKPPVVTIMGHVDHGKTTLLDFIRKTKLVAKEYGEITQAIGAYQIQVGGEKLTFIDTPGHEAFSKMRSWGAMVADLVVLVVAADDGVMPQTKESLQIIEEAKTPFLVAINKIDLPGVSLDKVKTQLAEAGVLVEGFGGKVVAVPISAKTGEGIDQLLEMILLTAEMTGLTADPEGQLEAVVIESKMDKFCGPVASLIVRNGTIKKGEVVSVGNVLAKVKMLKDEWGKSKEVAYPGDPVQVLGFSSLPEVGSLVTSAKDEIPSQIKTVPRELSLGRQEPKEGKIKIILKADVSGSLEAILGSLPKEVSVVEAGVGEITDSDVFLAKTVNADIYAFNLSLDSNLQKLAETENVEVKNFRLIYDLFKNIEERIMKPEIERKILGKAEIQAIFEMKGEKIAGCKVVEGRINRSLPVVLKREEKIISETKIISMRQQKQDISEAETGAEFGVVFAGEVDFRVGDVILSYSLEGI